VPISPHERLDHTSEPTPCELPTTRRRRDEAHDLPGGRHRGGQLPDRRRPRDPTALPPSLLTATLGAPAAGLGRIEGLSDGLAGGARLAGGGIADDRRRAQAAAGYTTTALSGLIGAATTAWQVAVLRAGTWAASAWRPRPRPGLVCVVVRKSRAHY
jgi:hypothetical protein